MSLSELIKLLKSTAREWLKQEPFKLSAIVAYYGILSLPALLIIVIDFVGVIWGREIVLGHLSDEMAGAFGMDTAQYIREIITKKGDTSTSVVATIIGFGTLFFGATGVFIQLQDALDTIWDAKEKVKSGIIATIIDRLKSFGFILVFGFLLLISLVLTTLISTFSDRINRLLPDGFLEFTFLIDIVISLGFVYLLFAAMFKYLPSTPIPWKFVRSGAALTSVLFLLGKYILAIYFAQAQPGSTYGVAGSVILIMLWVSYTSLILFFGAQFTKCYADRSVRLHS